MSSDFTKDVSITDLEGESNWEKAVLLIYQHPEGIRMKDILDNIVPDTDVGVGGQWRSNLRSDIKDRCNRYYFIAKRDFGTTLGFLYKPINHIVPKFERFTVTWEWGNPLDYKINKYVNGEFVGCIEW